MFFMSAILQEFIAGTNRYARHALGEDYSKFRPVTVYELRGYLIFCILMLENNLQLQVTTGDKTQLTTLHQLLVVLVEILCVI